MVGDDTLMWGLPPVGDPDVNHPDRTTHLAALIARKSGVSQGPGYRACEAGRRSGYIRG
jgi:hypothetical protein